VNLRKRWGPPLLLLGNLVRRPSDRHDRLAARIGPRYLSRGSSRCASPAAVVARGATSWAGSACHGRRRRTRRSRAQPKPTRPMASREKASWLRNGAPRAITRKKAAPKTQTDFISADLAILALGLGAASPAITLYPLRPNHFWMLGVLLNITVIASLRCPSSAGSQSVM
jgi:hypothetical protein